MSVTNGRMISERARRARRLPRWGRFRRQALSRVRLWLDLWSERRTLRGLDARALADLGLTPGDVRRETVRPFYDVPRGR